jgi:hypothetical protein
LGDVLSSGDINLDGIGYTEISGTTAGGETILSNENVEAIMRVRLRNGSFASPVGFTLTRLDPAVLVSEPGTTPTGAAMIDPLSAYRFAFDVPTLNQSASLSFDILLNKLDSVTKTALLQAVSQDAATMATKGDAPGSSYQSFNICAAGETPTVDGCIRLELLDAGGQPTTGTPSVLRFSNVVGHFSTWAIVIVTPTHSSSTCPLGKGYWKNNPNAWTVNSLTLGNQTYTKAELLTTLNTSVGSGKNADASLILAHQLIAAKLNVANGSDPAPVSSAIGDADNLLAAYAGKLPYRIKPSSASGQAMVSATSRMDSYNNGLLTLTCNP